MKRRPPENCPAPASGLTRRHFLGSTARRLGVTAFLAGLPRGWVGAFYASDAPETSDLKFGIIALTDCSSIVIAHEKGLFKKYGVNSTVAKGASWAAIRDSLSNGDIQATHMLTGMPIASTMGLLGSPRRPMIIPWMINRNGQSITLKKELKGIVQDDSRALKSLVEEAKKKGAPMTFAMTVPPGTHAMWMRYYLGDGRKKKDPNYMIFHQRNCNYPQPKYAVWWLTQFRRWGMVEGTPDYAGVARQVMRPDIYEEAMKEIGYAHGGQNNEPETLFDGAAFDRAKPEEYAKSFPINNLKG